MHSNDNPLSHSGTTLPNESSKVSENAEFYASKRNINNQKFVKLYEIVMGIACYFDKAM